MHDVTGAAIDLYSVIPSRPQSRSRDENPARNLHFLKTRRARLQPCQKHAQLSSEPDVSSAQL
jgi:hypothetical protein